MKRNGAINLVCLLNNNWFQIIVYTQLSVSSLYGRDGIPYNIVICCEQER